MTMTIRGATPLRSRTARLAGATTLGLALALGFMAQGTVTAMADVIAAPPAAATAKEGVAELPNGARLWYSDTGGNGPAVVFLHAFSGHAGSWPYQQPAFAKAGYRVILYSRRGFGKSEAGAPDKLGVAAEDLDQLLTLLGVQKAHIVGTAAGGSTALDFATAYPARTQSLVLGNSLMSIDEPDYANLSNMLRPKTFEEMPSEFKELSGSFRVQNPDAVKRWLAAEEAAKEGSRPRQGRPGKVTWDKLAALKMPVLLTTGDADLYQPPALLKMVGAKIPGSQVVIFDDVAHNPAWEVPDLYNKTLMDFFAKAKG